MGNVRPRALAEPCLALMAAAASGAAAHGPPPAPERGSYLYVWAGDADEKDSDFLAVIDARPGQPGYGKVVATLPVGARATMPHHVEYETPPG
ncbi:MAG TPA: hypothetical protein VFS45_06150, partial [Sphingomicrobium sp.]|nr:hypothetical protein [Sphingomicrobium sp.]